VNVIIVIGLQVFMGNTNISNLGHVSVVGIAAYVVAVLATPVAIKRTAIPVAPFGLATFQLDTVWVVLAALAITVAVAVLVGSVLTRQSGIAATIATLALLVIVHVVLVNWVDLTRGPRAFYGIPVKATLEWAIGLAMLAAVVARLFRDSPAGVQLRASSEDIAAARAMGVEVRRLRLLAWTLSSVFMAVAGMLMAYFVGTISPKSFYFDLVFLSLAMLILGGMRSVSGGVIGAMVVTLGFELMRYLENGPEIAGLDLPEMFGLTGFFLGAIIVGFMALRPEGLVGDDELDEILFRRSVEAAEVAAPQPMKEEIRHAG
jgi:branched-chain amino acid transport system permease protein